MSKKNLNSFTSIQIIIISDSDNKKVRQYIFKMITLTQVANYN